MYVVVLACRKETVKQVQLSDDGKKAYVPSETYKMVLEMDNKDDTSAEPTKPFNPIGGKYAAAFRGVDDEYSASDPNSPLYKPRDAPPAAAPSYTASQTVELKNPTRTGAFPTPPQPPHQPTPAPRKPEVNIVGHAFPGGNVQGDTMVVQNRSTITIPSKKPSNFGGANTPKPFGAPKIE